MTQVDEMKLSKAQRRMLPLATLDWRRVPWPSSCFDALARKGLLDQRINRQFSPSVPEYRLTPLGIQVRDALKGQP